MGVLQAQCKLQKEKYMLLANIDISKASSHYLFKRLVKVRSGFQLIQTFRPLRYTRARESMAGLLKVFVQDTANIRLHSLRAIPDHELVQCYFKFSAVIHLAQRIVICSTLFLFCSPDFILLPYENISFLLTLTVTMFLCHIIRNGHPS